MLLKYQCVPCYFLSYFIKLIINSIESVFDDREIRIVSSIESFILIIYELFYIYKFQKLFLISGILW